MFPPLEFRLHLALVGGCSPFGIHLIIKWRQNRWEISHIGFDAGRVRTCLCHVLHTSIRHYI